MSDDRRKLLQEISSHPRSRISRRDLLRRAGTGAGALSLAAFLAACGIDPQGPQSGSGSEDDGLTTDKKAGELDFANWIGYIDKDDSGDSPTIEEFEKETGISVNYEEAVNDNATFFATIRQQLAAGQAVGYDIIVVTDWLVGQDGPPRLSRRDRSAEGAELRCERRRDLQGPNLRPREQAQHSVAVGDHRHRLQPRAYRARDHQHRRPLRP